VADNADMAGEQQEVINDLIIRLRPRNAVRAAPGSDCMSCGAEIPAARLAVLPGACLCADCQEDVERVMR